MWEETVEGEEGYVISEKFLSSLAGLVVGVREGFCNARSECMRGIICPVQTSELLVVFVNLEYQCMIKSLFSTSPISSAG